MADEIIEELWRIKDDIAREHEYDPDALAAQLRNKRDPGRRRIEGLRSIRTIVEPGASADDGKVGGAPQ